jgi:hypothetical protein
MKKIIESKHRETEERVIVIDKLHKYEAEKINTDTQLARLKKENNELSEKLERLKLTLDEKKETWRIEKQRLELEKENEQMLNSKLITKETQYKIELKKRELQNTKYDDQIRKFMNEKNFTNLSINQIGTVQSKQSEMVISYCLNNYYIEEKEKEKEKEKERTNVWNDNLKVLDTKLKIVSAENEKSKKFLSEIYSYFAEIIQIKKRYYNSLSEYYETDYIEEISCPNKELVYNNIDLFLENFRAIFVKFKEYNGKIEEVKLQNNTNNDTLYNEYVNNLLNIIELISAL